MPTDAEVMADVVRNLRTGRMTNTMGRREAAVLGQMNLNNDFGRGILAAAVPVDVTPVHKMFMESKGYSLYEMRAAPPWSNALLTYITGHQNVWVMHLVASDFHNDPYANDAAFRSEIEWQPFPPADHTIDWTLVRWVMSIQVYLGGVGHGTWMPTTGPMIIWRLAVYPDGTIADVNWSRIPGVKDDAYSDIYDNVLGTVLETLNICSCVNVQIAEAHPRRPRHEQRRLDRTGVRFSEIHIKPLRKSYQGNGIPLGSLPAAHGVRGHYATYGGDRGLLFGKLSGRFWIPPHIRGSKEAGEVVQSYVAETG